MLTSKEFVCYHGTTFSAALSIINHGFKLSQSNEDWLGHGVYFFTDGISDPLQNAVEWTRNKNKGNEVCIIKARIEMNDSDILDLRTVNGLNVYNLHRDRIINSYYDDLAKRRDITIKKRKDTRVDDCIIMGILQRELKYKVVVHNVYVKNHLQRKLALESSYPNSTILCINELYGIEVIDVLNV